MSSDTARTYEEYLALAYEYLELEEHPEFRRDLEELLARDDHEELSDRFYRDLDFGTGGLRGVIGGGYNRMNTYTVKRATEGLARYLQNHAVAQEGKPISIVIAYDSRRYSREFADAAALVCAAHGIRAYVFESVRPTPELSFAVRYLSAQAGIVVTASHNPPEYNGYKVYWDDGAQVVPPHDTGIISEVNAVTGSIASASLDDAKEKRLYLTIGEEIDSAFIEMVTSYLHRTELVREASDEFSVVYTPLHGTGTMLIERLFAGIGMPCTTVPEQREPDGEFPTVASPNPEESAALEMAIELAKSQSADLVLATDPDADRLGTAVRVSPDEYRLLTGNQLGSLLADYVLRTHQELGTMPERPVLIKTIVTTGLQRRIAESYGATVYDVLTGFKYIGEKIREFETTGEDYVVGGEESYGYLVETEVRDKDSIGAAAVTAEMALWCRSQGLSLVDYLDDIYRRFGYYEELLESKRFPGAAGRDAMDSLMDRLRYHPPEELGGEPVIALLDYADGRIVEGGTVLRETIELPRSNVIQLKLPAGIVTARPSGTEPKIKFYASCWEHDATDLEGAKHSVGTMIESIRAAISEFV